MGAGALLLVSLVGPQESTVMWVPPAQPDLTHGVSTGLITLAMFGLPMLASWYRQAQSTGASARAGVVGGAIWLVPGHAQPEHAPVLGRDDLDC